MECTQVLLSESFDANNAVTEKIPVATLIIDGEHHTIYNTENVIGRENSCDVVISNSAVSSRHAAIEAEDCDAHLIYDLGSTNKTKLGKMTLKPHVRYHINDGDHVTFGNVSALYNISRKYATTPVKGSPNSCSIPETPEHLASTANGNEKVENSVLELSDTDLFEEKETDTNLYLKEIPTCSTKTSNDIYELDTLTFNEQFENRVEETAPVEDSEKICVIPPKDNIKVEGNDREVIGDKKEMPKTLLVDHFDLPEIASPDGLDLPGAENLDCPKSKVSSSFLDITNDDDLKSDQDIMKNIGGVILSDLCKPDSSLIEVNKQDISSSLKERESKRIEENEEQCCFGKTSEETKSDNNSDHNCEQYSENEHYIPMSQNIDMFEDISDKPMDECSKKSDVYEMLTQVSIENKEIDNSIYDEQTQVVLGGNESRFVKDIDASFSSSPKSSLGSVLEPATQPSEFNYKDKGNDTSYYKVKVVDETDYNCSFSSSIYEAATQPCFQNPVEESALITENMMDENQSKHGKGNNFTSIFVASLQPTSEILNCEKSKVDHKDSIVPAVIEEATQRCPRDLVIPDSVSVDISNRNDENESLTSTIIEEATQPCPQGSVTPNSTLVEISKATDENEILTSTIFEEATQPCPKIFIDASNQSHASKEDCNITNDDINNSSLPSSISEAATQPCSVDKSQLQLKTTENNSSANISSTELSMCDWYEVATQPCRPPSENVDLIDEELHKKETTKNDEEELKNEARQNNSFSISMYEIATQPCQKDNFTDKTFSDNKSTLNSDITSMDESNKNNTISTSISEISTQPCPKHIVSEKNDSIGDTNLELTLINENNKDSSFSASMCEIATQPCSLTAKDSIHQYELKTNHGNISHLNVNDFINDDELKFKESKTPLVRNEIDITIEPNIAIKNIAPSKIIHELDNESNSKMSGKSFKIVDKSLIDLVERESINLLSGDKTKNLIISESSLKLMETTPIMDNPINDSFFEVATQPAPCPIDLNLPANDEIVSVIPKVSETSCEIEKDTRDNSNITEEVKNIKVSHKPNDVSVTSVLPNALSDSFFEAATQPYKNYRGEDRTFPDPLTSICNDLSDDKIGEISEELMFGNISAKLEDKNKIIHCNNTNKKTVEIQSNVETSDHNIYEAVARQVPFCSQKNIPLDKINPEYPPEKITTQDLQRILESDDLTQKYDEFKETNGVPTLSDHTLNSESDLLKNNFGPTKENTITDKKIHDDQMVRLLSVSESTSLLTLDSQCSLKTNPKAALDGNNEDLLKAETKKQCDENVPDAPHVSGKVICLDNDSSQELIITSNKRHFGIFPSDSRSFANKFSENDETTQELIIRSNKKRSCVFPSDSQSFTSKFSENDDSSQEVIIRSNKKRSGIFPSDSQSFTNKFSEEDESTQELIIRSNKKRSGVFPSDSQNFTNKLSENDDSTQELIIRSNKKRSGVFPSDSQSFTNKFLKNDGLFQEQSIESCKKSSNVITPDNQDFLFRHIETTSYITGEKSDITLNKNSEIGNSKPSDNVNKEIITDNDVQMPKSDDGSFKIINNASIVNDGHLDVKKKSTNLDNKLGIATNHKGKIIKGKYIESISTSGKHNNKETKNKSTPERERESAYVSRGNITLHSPEVLSELEEQFRLTKVAMSPTQLSVVSDIDDEIQSSQEVNELEKKGIRRSVRQRKNAVPIQNLDDNESSVSQQVLDSVSSSNKNLLKEDGNKIKEISSFSSSSKNEKSFKKFKKVSHVKDSPPSNDKVVDTKTNENDAESLMNNSDNSQNSEELGRGKRKRTRPSYEGFIIEEDKKRTSRKKLSFSNSEDSENMNNAIVKTEQPNNCENMKNAIVKIEQINKNTLDGLTNHKKNNDISNSTQQSISVVLNDFQKVVSTEVITAPKKKASKKKASPLSRKKNETSHVLIANQSKLLNSKDEAKQNEISTKDKNISFSFSEKLDELFNIWGPADRVKLSPRTAKKSYKLLAEGKTESPSSRTHALNVSDKEPKPSTSSSNKNSLKKNEPESVVEMSYIGFNRKRNLPKKIGAAEIANDLPKQNKRRKANSENSEISQEPDKNDHDLEVRKSTRNTRKKNLYVPVEDNKTERDSIPIKRASNETGTRFNKRSTENIEDSGSVSKNNTKESLGNSNNASMKPPLTSVIVSVKNKKLKTNEKNNPLNYQEHQPPGNHEENYCFSQEYSFHESTIEKGKKKPINSCSNPPLKIRRSGRKKNEKTAEKNVESVMFTGFADKKTKSIVSELGGQIVESPFTCTVLVTDKIRRTTKFLSALSRGLPIVSPQWLINSNKHGRFLDSRDFLLSDHETEAMFSFNLKNSIEKAQNGKMLDGWAVYVTPSVKPSPDEMKSIIECSGGRFLLKELARWPANSFIVSCKEDSAMWAKFSKKGKGPIIVDNEAILLGVLKQELDLESHKLQ